MNRVLLGLLVLAVASRAEARCRVPQLALIWSYPAAGASDVPTNAELWVLAPYAWWNPVARLDGQEIAYTPEYEDRGLVHLRPGALQPNHDYVLQLDYTGVRPGEDAGVDPVIEIRFRTGAQAAIAPAAPMLGSASAADQATPGKAIESACPDVIEAQDCWDTGPYTLLSFAAEGDAPIAWLVDERLIPARCERPQRFARRHLATSACLSVRAIGAGGLLSEPSTACAPSVADASTTAIDEVRPAEGCAAKSGHGGAALIALALWARRRRSLQRQAA